MKEIYENPKVEITSFPENDVITTSSQSTGPLGWGDNYDSSGWT
jgi:hypothetical protein